MTIGDEMDQELRRKLEKRRLVAQHAMQAGVGFEIERDFPSMPAGLRKHLKHERVGLNSCMVDIWVLAKLLIEKGVFTFEEYLNGLAEGMEAEHKRYEEHLGVKLGSLYHGGDDGN